MKKSLAIGATSAVLAAMPIVGVFATSQTVTVTDTLQATISTACVFKRYGEAGASGQGAAANVTPAWDGPVAAADPGDNDDDITTNPKVYHKYSATFMPGDDIELGTSHFTGYCNDEGGFTVTVATPALSNGAVSPATELTLPFLTASPSTSASEGYAIVKDATGTPAQFTNTSGDTVFMSSNTATDSSSAVTETATYTVYTLSTTKSGTYTGNVVYTFTYDDPTV